MALPFFFHLAGDQSKEAPIGIEGVEDPCLSYPNPYHLSIGRFGGESTVDDFPLAAKARLPITSAMLAKIKKRKTFPSTCFLNIELPLDVWNHKDLHGRSLRHKLDPCLF